MSKTSISPLRRRLIEDMTVRNFVEKTRHDYIRHVKTFTAFLGRSPDTATPEDLRRSADSLQPLFFFVIALALFPLGVGPAARTRFSVASSKAM